MFQLSGANTCHCHQFLPTLTVPKSDSLPVPLPTYPHPDHEEDEEEGEEFGSPWGLLGFLCRGIDGTSEEDSVDGTNPESMFQ